MPSKRRLISPFTICHFHFISNRRVLICDFHREKAWERWTKKVENSVGKNRNKVLSFTRDVAKADTEEKFKMTTKYLTENNCWKQNIKSRKCFQNVWLSKKEVSLAKFFR